MKEEQEKQGSRYTINSIEKALDLLELLSERESASLIELVELLQQPKSSLYRIISTLENRGFITRSEEDGKYCLGYKHLRLLKNLLEKNTLRNSALPEMNRLVAKFGDTVNLGVLSEGQVLYLEIIEGTYALRMTDRVGSTAPIHATAMGKVMVAHMNSEQRKKVLNELKFTQLTANTVVNKKQLLAVLDKVKTDGFALDDQEIVEGARCVASPIFDMFNKVVGSISVSGAVHRIADDRFEQIVNEVKKAAETISHKLGYVATEQ